MSEGYIIDRARALAERAHKGQVRKYTGEPYILHPAEVAGLIVSVDLPLGVIAAAWLHDVVEDCGTTREQIAQEVGEGVAALVMEVTDVSKPTDGNRAKRKAMDRDHLANASPEGQSIKLADIISNTTSIVERDPDFAKVYLREKRELLPLLRRGHPLLWAAAAHVVGLEPVAA